MSVGRVFNPPVRAANLQQAIGKESKMRPKFWYCPFCGYMFMDTGKGNLNEVCCPMCGEEVMPCWECIAKGEFDATLCRKCENKRKCQAKFAARNLPSTL